MGAVLKRTIDYMLRTRNDQCQRIQIQHFVSQWVTIVLVAAPKTFAHHVRNISNAQFDRLIRQGLPNVKVRFSDRKSAPAIITVCLVNGALDFVNESMVALAKKTQRETTHIHRRHHTSLEGKSHVGAPNNSLQRCEDAQSWPLGTSVVGNIAISRTALRVYFSTRQGRCNIQAGSRPYEGLWMVIVSRTLRMLR